MKHRHKVEELGRAQEMRIDECSRYELRESHAEIQELTSQIQELQERMNQMNDSGEFQDVDHLQWKRFPRFPVKRHLFQVLVEC